MTIYPPLEIPETLAAGPGPGNTDHRVLERFAKTGLADHMQKDVLRGMIEAKESGQGAPGAQADVGVHGPLETGSGRINDLKGFREQRVCKRLFRREMKEGAPGWKVGAPFFGER